MSSCPKLTDIMTNYSTIKTIHLINVFLNAKSLGPVYNLGDCYVLIVCDHLVCIISIDYLIHEKD